jgi:hypothetical protein
MKIYKPKEDFNNAIALQNHYVKLLQNYHKELLEKTKNTNGFQKSKYDVELYELSMKLDTQSLLLQEKLDHYNNNFLKNYDKELKECEENFENYYKNSLQMIEENFDIWLEKLKGKIARVEEKLILLDEREVSYEGYPEEKTINIGFIVHERNELRNKQKGLTDMLNSSQDTKKTRYDKIKFLIDDYDNESTENKNHIELKNVLYKDLKNLVNLPNIE